MAGPGIEPVTPASLVSCSTSVHGPSSISHLYTVVSEPSSIYNTLGYYNLFTLSWQQLVGKEWGRAVTIIACRLWYTLIFGSERVPVLNLFRAGEGGCTCTCSNMITIVGVNWNMLYFSAWYRLQVEYTVDLTVISTESLRCFPHYQYMTIQIFFSACQYA